MDKVNFVIFVITPVLLELQVDKTTRVARHFALTLHTLFRVFECLDPGVRHCVYNLVKEHRVTFYSKVYLRWFAGSVSKDQFCRYFT